VRRFCEDLERAGTAADWQVEQARHALRLYFVNFLERPDWSHQSISRAVDEDGRTTPLAALDQLRRRLRTRHYSYRTECTYVDWVRRFLDYVAQQQGLPTPRVDSASVRDYLTYLALRQRVSASTQNQAFCAIFLLCREVLGVKVESLSLVPRAPRVPRPRERRNAHDLHPRRQGAAESCPEPLGHPLGKRQSEYGQPGRHLRRRPAGARCGDEGQDCEGGLSRSRPGGRQRRAGV
jgi:hypothetical protein